jgi:hypothetical protein
MSLADGPPAHHGWLTPDTLRIVAGWFETAGFRALPQESYFGGGVPGRICEIFLCDSMRVVHRVIGDEAALPETVRLLVRELDELATHILLTTPDTPPPPPPPDSTWVPPPVDSTWVPPPVPQPFLHGDLAASPESAPEGTPRTIRLALLNDTRDTVMLRFPTSQLYDLVLRQGSIEPPWPPQPPPGGDSTWVPPIIPPPPGGDSTWVPSHPHPGGGPGCPHPGGGPGGHPGHGDPDDPPFPPDSTWTPPDSGDVPPDTSWVPPPDSTWIPPEPRVLWNWAHDRAFLQVPTMILLPPGGTVVYTETWDGRSNQGSTVGPGTYMLTAPFLSDVPVMNGMVRLEVTGR